MEDKPMKQYVRIIPALLAAVLLLTTSATAGLLVDGKWLKAHRNDPNLVVVDVQNKPGSYDQGHIPGAVKVVRHVDLEDPTRYPPNKYPRQRQFLNLMRRLGIDNDTTVVAYDDKPSIFASRLLFVMELYGHDINKLKLLDGGIAKWKKEGNRLSTSSPLPRSARRYVTNGPDATLLVSWSDVFNDVIHKQKPDVVLHDARPLAEFNGTRIRAIRGGHIPGAVNLEAVKVANNKDHTFKEVDDIRRAFVAAGITGDRTIYTYCHSSDRSAHAYMVLKHLLGYPRVKVYEGAWNEWAALTALPAADEEYK